MRRLAVLALITGCAPDPCASFAGKTCIALEVDGTATLDQLRITSNFGLSDAPSPSAPLVQAVTPPVMLAVLAGDLEGDYTLSVRAQLGGDDVAFASGSGKLQRGG